MKIDYKRTEEKDFKGLCNLFEICFNKKITQDYWQWKYKNGISFVAVNNGEVVGHYGGIFFDFYLNKKVYKIVQATDLMTHPGVRHIVGSKNVLTNLANIFFDFCLKKGIDFAYGFPGERSRLFGERFLGYKPVEKVKFFLKKNLKEDPNFPIEPFYFLNYEIKKIIKKNKFIGIKKDLSYFFWRYIENPLYKYYYSFNKNSFIILKFQGKEAIIMDFLFINYKSFKKLLNGIEASLKNSGIEFLKGFPNFFLNFFKFEILEENYYLEHKPLKKDLGRDLKLEFFFPSDYDLF